MQNESKTLLTRMNQVKNGFKNYGVKLTHQRLEIFNEVAKSEDHPDAETIFKRVRERVPTVSLDTVYRTLWLLNELGLVNTLGTSRERVRFDGNMNPHHHFVCTRCGMTRDFYNKAFDDVNILDAVKAFGTLETVQVEARGVCLQCSEEINNKPKNKNFSDDQKEEK